MAAPSIIFFDEFDSLVPARGSQGDTRVAERVISQLLTEIDGLLMLQNVLVIAATNRPDIIDPAVLRPGRFDRRVYVPAPDDAARLRILQVKTENMPLDKEVHLEDLVRKMDGYSGADIESVTREAGMNSLRRDRDTEKVTFADFEDAMAATVPSITPEMEKWYQQTDKMFKEREKPPMTIV
jgi:transitional endoplasmic reticulum ATPase